MVSSTGQGKTPRVRMLPPRPRGEPRNLKLGIACTVTEKRKVQRMAEVVYGNVDESELLYFRSLNQLVRQHDEMFGTETPNR